MIRTSLVAGIVIACVALVGLSTVDVETVGATPSEAQSQVVAVAPSQGLSSLPILLLALTMSILLAAALIYQRSEA